VPYRGPFFIEATHVHSCIRESFLYYPIELAAQEAMWLYAIHGSQQLGTTEAGPVPDIVFTSGHQRYRADARFDLSYWNFSNYAEIG